MQHRKGRHQFKCSTVGTDIRPNIRPNTAGIGHAVIVTTNRKFQAGFYKISIVGLNFAKVTNISLFFRFLLRFVRFDSFNIVEMNMHM